MEIFPNNVGLQEGVGGDGSFEKNRGMRIDYFLVSKPLVELCKNTYIDKTPRKLDKPSDHTPVVVEISL